MKSLPSPSKPANFSDSLHLYALAASAAGVSVLALAQPAEAEIVYTPVQVTIAPGQTYGLDVNQDGIVDFNIHNRAHNTTSGFDASVFVRPAAGNAVAGHIVRYGRFNWAYALTSGMRIDKADRHFAPGRATMAFSNYFVGSYSRGGSWISYLGFQTRFLGLRFKIDGQLHYGWARLNVQTRSTTITATLTGFAYETIADKPIKAGDEQGKDDVSVKQPGPALTKPAQQPATLGMLALGSSALSAWRRNESKLVRN